MTIHEAVEVLKDGSLYDKRFNSALDMAIEALEKVPPERVKGKWIKLSHWDKCSFCNTLFNSNLGMCERNFCPDCGAEMVGIEEIWP